MNASKIGAVLLSCLGLTACGGSPIDVSNPTEAWDANNDPGRLRGRYVVRLASLPTAGQIPTPPWTDSYWPNFRGGLADRWNAQGMTDAFTYSLNDRVKVATMSLEEKKTLSPAEKYDIYVGRYDYPTVARERSRTKASDPTWHGLCHGWAPAALAFREPGPVTLKGANGIDVPFGASDVKALLTYVQQLDGSAASLRFLGSRCNRDASDSGAASARECRDVNAGSFHIILANQIGLEKQGFVADIERHAQVWNQPIHAYSSRILSTTDRVYQGAAPGTVRIARVSTTTSYIAEVKAQWDRVPYSSGSAQSARVFYEYDLELNASGDIIGGEWIGEGRPDFLWTQPAPRFTGTYAAVETIYKAAADR